MTRSSCAGRAWCTISALGSLQRDLGQARPLSAAELERVRLHPYLTERMLAASEALAPLGAIAVQHHERLDGSGYPRGLSGDALTPAGRILAAADAYHAMTEPRPHRDAHTAEEAAAELRSGVRAALFDSDAAEAVLSAAGHPGKRRRDWPGGLTSREIEVLRLLVRGTVEQGDRGATRDLAQDRGQPRGAHLLEGRRVQSRSGEPVRRQARPDGGQVAGSEDRANARCGGLPASVPSLAWDNWVDWEHGRRITGGWSSSSGAWRCSPSAGSPRSRTGRSRAPAGGLRLGVREARGAIESHFPGRGPMRCRWSCRRPAAAGRRSPSVQRFAARRPSRTRSSRSRPGVTVRGTAGPRSSPDWPACHRPRWSRPPAASRSASPGCPRPA